MFGGAELAHFISQATWVTVNEYDRSCCSRRRLGVWRAQKARGRRSIVTRRRGRPYPHARRRDRDPVCQAEAVVDPTDAVTPIVPVSSTACCTVLTGEHRAYCLAHGRHQDRVARHAESPALRAPN